MNRKTNKTDILDALCHREQIALKRVERDEIEAAAAKAEAASVRAVYRRALAHANAKKSAASVRYRAAARALFAAEAAFKKARIESARANAAVNRIRARYDGEVAPATAAAEQAIADLKAARHDFTLAFNEAADLAAAMLAAEAQENPGAIPSAKP